MTGTPPKVFISYSHDTVEHQDRVLGFADRLRAEGIDAEVDQYNTSPPEGWPLWCERQIEAADFVLMVCTETYQHRVKGDEEPGTGLGVVWEARIIRQHVYEVGAVSDKFVPVLFSDASPEQIPTLIKGWTWYVVDTEDGYEELYRRLTKQPWLVRPGLGAIRPLPARHRKWTEAQSQATTASTQPPSEGTVAAGDDRSVAIGGNVIGGAVVLGDHNVTSITASDTNAARRHNLQEFSQSAECKTLIQQLQARHIKLSKSARRHIMLFPFMFIIIVGLVSLIGSGLSSTNPFGTILSAFLFIFIPGSIVYFMIICSPYSWARADVYPVLILERHISGSEWTVTLEKVDGSRVVAASMYFEALPGEVGVAVTRAGLIDRKRHLMLSFNNGGF